MSRALLPTALLALVAGCADRAPLPLETPAEPLGLNADDAPYVRVSPAALELLARQEDWLELAHVGRRRVAVFDEDGLETSFVERVATDGTGRFAIDPVEPLSFPPAEWDVFRLRQLSRQGLIFKHRDFAIRDLGLFQDAWTLNEVGDNRTVAGRRCDLFEVERPGVVHASRYRVLVDAEGLVLAYREFDGEGRLRSEVRYETFDDSPAQETLDAIPWYEAPAEDTLELDWTQPLEPQIPQLGNARVFQPHWLPNGFALRRASTAVVATQRWLRLEYTDGVELVFYGLDLPGLVPEGGTTPFTPSPSTPDSVHVYSVGRTSALQGMLRNRQVMAFGKADTELLIDLVESSLP